MHWRRTPAPDRRRKGLRGKSPGSEVAVYAAQLRATALASSAHYDTHQQHGLNLLGRSVAMEVMAG